MIDNYAWFSIVVRAITLIISLFVLNRILNLTKKVTRDQWIKYVLTILIVIVLFNAGFSLISNFFRQDDGNLRQHIRHMSLVVTSVSGLASSIGWYVLLRKDD